MKIMSPAKVKSDGKGRLIELLHISICINVKKGMLPVHIINLFRKDFPPVKEDNKCCVWIVTKLFFLPPSFYSRRK